jgi:hypothetical protein
MLMTLPNVPFDENSRRKDLRQRKIPQETGSRLDIYPVSTRSNSVPMNLTSVSPAGLGPLPDIKVVNIFPGMQRSNQTQISRGKMGSQM